MKMLDSNYYYYFVLWWLLGNQQLTITTELLMSKSPWGLLKVSSFKKKVSSFMKFQLLISCSSDHYRHLVFLVDHPHYEAYGLPVVLINECPQEGECIRSGPLQSHLWWSSSGCPLREGNAAPLFLIKLASCGDRASVE